MQNSTNRIPPADQRGGRDPAADGPAARKKWNEAGRVERNLGFLIEDEHRLQTVIKHLQGQLDAHMDKGRTSEAARVAGVIAENERRLKTTKARLGRTA